ncbi:hypothetical protein [Bacillus sp. TL12]|uniref:hypothetical protein n=1 Tax=Bacillus sp. TL12 TaxID=2894756 RepID=UPI001F52988F|nr:hypothetical protein [Bacillus sp. TL12]MCI0768259.1 hypothetical protein [Bacillus sp. TL12]
MAYRNHLLFFFIIRGTDHELKNIGVIPHRTHPSDLTVRLYSKHRVFFKTPQFYFKLTIERNLQF